MNNPYIFNAPFVYVDSIENHSEIKKKYYSKILEYSKEIKKLLKIGNVNVKVHITYVT